MKDEYLKMLLLKLLESGIYKTALHLAAELKAEHPAQWRELEKEAELLFGAGCGAHQQPAARVAQALQDMPPELLEIKLDGRERSYRKKARPG